MSRTRPFSGGQTVKITVAATTANVKVCEQRNGPLTVRICNLGSAPAWIKGGGSTVTAAVTDIPVPAGATDYQTFNPGQDGRLYIAAIAASTTGDIHFTPGEGI